tara:strand:- start:2120 stop:2488 length:369 start_codon:yes stop_codon:yes gene_type:complete
LKIKNIYKLILVTVCTFCFSYSFAGKHRFVPNPEQHLDSLYVVLSFKGDIYAVPMSFIKSHPGGSEVLYAVSGYDISKIWEKDKKYSFHLWKKRVAKYLKRFKVGRGSLPSLTVKNFDIKIS